MRPHLPGLMGAFFSCQAKPTLKERLCHFVLVVGFSLVPSPGPASPAPPDASREICRRHLEAIGQALAAYQRDHGELPPQLSALCPGYLKDRALLHCPADRSPGTTGVPWMNPDPVPVSYLYEMSLTPRAHGLLLGPVPMDQLSTWRGVKMAQRATFGDAVPAVTCWHHWRRGYRWHLTLSGRVYRSASGAGWEYDPVAVNAALSQLEQDLAAGPLQFRRRWWPRALAYYFYGLAGQVPIATRQHLGAVAGRLAARARTDPRIYDGDIWSVAGSLYYASGDAVKAADAFQAAIKNPGRRRATPYLLLADIYRLAASADKATNLTQAMPAVTQPELYSMEELVRVYQCTGRPKQATAWALEANRVTPDRAAGWIRWLALAGLPLAAAIAAFIRPRRPSLRGTAPQGAENALAMVDAPDVSAFSSDVASPVPQKRPWVRFWARGIDQLIWAFFLVIAFSVAVLSHVVPIGLLDNAPGYLLGPILLLLWAPVEAGLLSTWGTTPGKWLLSVSVRTLPGEKPSYRAALQRSFAVWAQGLGVGIPLIQLITFTSAYNELEKRGTVSWDRQTGLTVVHEPFRAWRIVTAIGLYVVLTLLVVLLFAHSR